MGWRCFFWQLIHPKSITVNCIFSPQHLYASFTRAVTWTYSASYSRFLRCLLTKYDRAFKCYLKCCVLIIGNNLCLAKDTSTTGGWDCSRHQGRVPGVASAFSGRKLVFRIKWKRRRICSTYSTCEFAMMQYHRSKKRQAMCLVYRHH